MATWNSRGLRGSTLEEMVNRTNEWYLDKGLALMQKIPTPITPIRMVGGGMGGLMAAIAAAVQRAQADHAGIF